jgi:hypothetical protein
MIMLVNSGVFVCITRFVWKKPLDIRFTKERAISFFLQTLVSCYTLLISGAVSPLLCYKQLDGTQVMVRSPGVVCYGEEWSKYYGTIIFFAILYGAIFPFSFLCLLITKKQTNSESNSSINYLSPFVSQFSAQYFWWEIPILVRKALFVIVIGLIPVYPGSSAPYFGCICMMFAFLSLETFLEPFKHRYTAKRSEMWSFVILLVLLSDALVFKSDGVSYTTKTAFSALLILIVALAFASLFQVWLNKLSLCGNFWKQQTTSTQVVIAVDAELQVPKTTSDFHSGSFEPVSSEYVHDNSTNLYGILPQPHHNATGEKIQTFANP